MPAQNGITLISLIITIILMLILAGVIINLTIGENGLFKMSKKAGEDYKIASIKERVEQEIISLQTGTIVNDEKLTVEQALIGIQEKEAFNEIDLLEEIGIIDGYIIVLGYDTWDNVIIKEIKKDTGIRLITKTTPKGFTNKKIEISINISNTSTSIVNLEVSTGMSKKDNLLYEVEKNGNYFIKATLSNGQAIEKEIKINTIDTLPPKNFEINGESTIEGIIINGQTKDQEANNENACSGIDRYEYIVVDSTGKEITYNSNEINGLETGTYNVYVFAYDNANNKTKSNIITINVEEWIKIYTEEDLRNISNHLDKNYLMMNDIELSQEWIPIGNEKNYFTGKFDGNNHQIINLIIENSNLDAVGLFGSTFYNSQIMNLTVSGIIKSKTATGGLVGNNMSTIKNCCSNVEISKQLNTLGSSIGGLVGINGGTIQNSYSTEKVTGMYYVGGLVGLNNGTILDSYSIGEVIGDWCVGGLIGSNYGEATNIYTLSKITSDKTQDIGGLIGYSENDTGIKNGYYSEKISGIETSGGGTALTLEQMKQQSSYEGFDFTNIWVMK